MNEPKKPRGRPPKPEDEKLTRRAMHLTGKHWAKIDAAGLEQFRKLIERWKPKT